MEKRRSIWDCCGYGPADLLQVWKTESTLKLLLRDSAGEKAEAVYHGCIYHRLGPQTSGIHLSEVRRVSVRELLEDPRCVSVLALRKNSANVAQMLHDWENAGLSFYLHKGNAAYMEFLVVCQSMEYRQTGN